MWRHNRRASAGIYNNQYSDLSMAKRVLPVNIHVIVLLWWCGFRYCRCITGF
jgi:hypothetical protein